MTNDPTVRHKTFLGYNVEGTIDWPAWQAPSATVTGKTESCPKCGKLKWQSTICYSCADETAAPMPVAPVESPQEYCDCELRNRQWNPFTGKCEACNRVFKQPAAPVPPKPNSTLEYAMATKRDAVPPKPTLPVLWCGVNPERDDGNFYYVTRAYDSRKILTYTPWTIYRLIPADTYDRQRAAVRELIKKSNRAAEMLDDSGDSAMSQTIYDAIAAVDNAGAV